MKNIYLTTVKHLTELDLDRIVIFITIGVFLFARIMDQTIYRMLISLFLVYFSLKILLRGKIILNYAIYWYTFFIFTTLFTTLYSQSYNNHYSYVVISTFLTIIMFSQYFDSLSKVKEILIIYVFWGIIFNLYVLFKADFSLNARLGNEGTLGNFENAISFSYYIIVITTILLWYFIYEKKQNFFVFPAIIISFYLSMMSGGRKAVFLPILFTFVLLYLKNKKNFIKLFVSICFISAISVLIYFLSIKFTPLYEVFGFRLEQTIFSILGIGDGMESSFSDRISVINNGWELFLQRPLFGYGLGESRTVFASSLDWESHAHNNYMELLISGGTLLLISYYWIYIYSLIKLFKIDKKDKSGIPQFFIAFIIMNLVSDFGTTSFYLSIYINMIILTSIYIIHFFKQAKKINNDQNANYY